MVKPSQGVTVEVYTRIARTLHWATVVLLALQFPVGLYMVYRGGTLNLWDGLTNTLYDGHKLSGLVILTLVLGRLAYRVARGAPADEPTLAPWQRVVSHATHWGLYALLLAVPVAGYVGISLFPALDLFGLVTLPGLVTPDEAAAKTAFFVHWILALMLAGLIAMHVGAALHHYLIRKDNVLGRMIPRLLRR
jgi:cytochrome b561